MIVCRPKSCDFVDTSEDTMPERLMIEERRALEAAVAGGKADPSL